MPLTLREKFKVSNFVTWISTIMSMEMFSLQVNLNKKHM